jgi:nitrate reductase NapAB chaperone NapD
MFNCPTPHFSIVIPIGFMFIQCRQNDEDEILQRISRIDGVIYAYKLDKSYDIVVKIESESAEKFTTAISLIRAIGGILNTDTMVGFKP